MRTRLGFLRRRYTLLSLLVAGLACSAVGLYPGTALAQGNRAKPDRLYSTGPFQLHDGEHVLIGLLVPAVQRAKASARFQLLDGQGMRLFSEVIGPSMNEVIGPSMNTSVFFNITYRAADPKNPNAGGGVFEVREDAYEPFKVPSQDGILIGLLLPAVQPNGKTASPLATSMQSFNVNGGTMTHAGFDVFFDVF